MTNKSITYIAVFGALWGLVEATLGSVLHLVNAPFSGTILSAIGMIIILIARGINPQPGSTLIMAFIAALIKIMSLSTVKLGPFIGIVLEGVLLEITLTVFSTGFLGFLISGLVVSIYPLIQTLTVKTILFGADFIPVILEMVQGFSDRFGFGVGWWVLGLYIAIHFLLGLGGAVFAWFIKSQLNLTN